MHRSGVYQVEMIVWVWYIPLVEVAELKSELVGKWSKSLQEKLRGSAGVRAIRGNRPNFHQEFLVPQCGSCR